MENNTLKYMADTYAGHNAHALLADGTASWLYCESQIMLCLEKENELEEMVATAKNIFPIPSAFPRVETERGVELIFSALLLFTSSSADE